MKGRGQLNTHAISESVLKLFTQNYYHHHLLLLFVQITRVKVI